MSDAVAEKVISTLALGEAHTGRTPSPWKRSCRVWASTTLAKSSPCFSSWKTHSRFPFRTTTCASLRTVNDVVDGIKSCWPPRPPILRWVRPLPRIDESRRAESLSPGWESSLPAGIERPGMLDLTQQRSFRNCPHQDGGLLPHCVSRMAPKCAATTL